MHEAAFANAALPAPVTVLGIPLRHYSLGHELYLIRERNPLLGGALGENSLPQARARLAEAVLICCQSWEENQSTHRDWLIGLKLFIWRHRTRRLSTAAETFKLLAYLRAGRLELPPSEITRMGNREPGRIPGAPFLLRLHQFLRSNFRMSETEAWDYPFGRAKMEWQAHWESEGACYIKNAHEIEFERFCAEEEAAEAKRKNSALGESAPPGRNECPA